MNSLKKYKDYIFVALILIIAIVLRVIAINNYGALTVDEPYSWRFAHYDSVFEVIKKVITIDVYMPLYFVYLHYWIKIVGDTPELLHYSSLFLFLPTIPFAFYFAKKHFNKLTAYYLIILLALNTFCIYYSIFVRFYSALMLFGLLLPYFLIEVCEKFDKKSIIGLIITHILFFYTYNLEIVYAFFCCLVGLFYIYKHKKEKIKDFIKICFLILSISIPGIFLMINNTILLHNSICSYVKEFYDWDNRIIYNFFENLFTFDNFQIVTNNFHTFKNFSIFKYPLYVLFVFLPFLIALLFFIKALFSKNRVVFLSFVPPILSLILIIILAKFELIYFRAKYLFFLIPVIFCTISYGFSKIKYKEISIIVFFTYIILNLANLHPLKKSVVNLRYHGQGSMVKVFKENNIDDNSIILSPFIPEVTKYYHRKKYSIPFSIHEAFFMKDKWSLEFYFGKDNLNKINRSNILKYMESNIIKDIPEVEFEKNLVENYISKMKSGQKFVIINSWEIGTGACEHKLAYDSAYLSEMQKSGETFFIAIIKVIRDSIIIAEKYLKPIKILKNSTEGVAIYIYEKE